MRHEESLRFARVVVAYKGKGGGKKLNIRQNKTNREKRNNVIEGGL